MQKYNIHFISLLLFFYNEKYIKIIKLYFQWTSDLTEGTKLPAEGMMCPQTCFGQV
jgi:hypothetical protein